MNFDAIHFIRPMWLLAVPLAILIPWWWRHARRPSGDWEKICDPHLLKWLSVQQAGSDKNSAGSWLAGLALLLGCLALAGPSWQQLPENTFSARDARVVALDLSTSMLAEDLRPNRLTRARFRLDDLLNDTLEGQTGLVAFAGDAYVVSPLTNDMNTIGNLLPALQPDIVPVGGSRADLALDLAAALLNRAGFERGEILLVTDSADARDAATARELHDRGIITSVLGVGTTEGAPIPSGSGFVNDRSGNVVIARLSRAMLRDVANAGGGKYTEISVAGDADDNPWASSETSGFARRDDALDERWKDSGPYLVLLLLPLAALSFRKGALFAVPLLMTVGLAHTPDARADWWDDIWLRKDQQAAQALEAGEADRAASLAVDPELSGEAWYRSGSYDNATTAWSEVNSADGFYNRGNALALLGEYQAALDAYDRALGMQPDMDDARFNRDLVEQLLQQQEQQQQDEEQEGDEGQSSDGESEGEPSDSQSSDQQAEEGENDESQSEQQSDQEGEQNEGEGEQGERSETEYAQAWSEEDAQAMEQWLRRIPDDPGGLLRRKFIYEHQRRGAPEDEVESW